MWSHRSQEIGSDAYRQYLLWDLSRHLTWISPVATLVITGKVITLEMGPGYQKAKNTIGPDRKSFLGIRLSALNSNIDHQFPGHFWIITQNNLKWYSWLYVLRISCCLPGSDTIPVLCFLWWLLISAVFNSFVQYFVLFSQRADLSQRADR